MPYLKIFMLSSGNLWERTLNWYQKSVIKELLEHLQNNVFHLGAGVYDNFSMTEKTGNYVSNIIIGLILGMIFASVAAYYTRAVQGRFVRELLKRECFSPEQAVTLHDCGFFCNPSVRRELIKGGALFKIVRLASEPTAETDPKAEAEPNLLTACYYIPEDEKYKAEFRYRRQGSGGLHLLLSILICIIAAVLIFKGLPILLNFADWLITVLS
ncbi:MAG: hypothetical protein IKC59_07240 [Clostridia bacterium]|nr:hypothetical protein [Clostridia bacterium]